MFLNIAAPYVATTHLVVSLASILLVYGIYKIFAFVYDELTSPLRHVPGPPNPSFLYGTFKQISESVSLKLIFSRGDGLSVYILNRIIPSCRMIGSSNTDRQSITEGF